MKKKSEKQKELKELKTSKAKYYYRLGLVDHKGRDLCVTPETKFGCDVRELATKLLIKKHRDLKAEIRLGSDSSNEYLYDNCWKWAYEFLKRCNEKLKKGLETNEFDCI